jgi:Fusaric acid resistance protein-like
VARAYQRLRTAAVYDGIQAGLERLRTDGWLIVQTAGAAAIAWLLAAAVLHHQQAGFAPIGAVIAVEVTRGQQVRHAIELVLGVTLGIGVAVLLGSVIGNPPLRIAVVVGVAMTLALLVSGSLVLVVQAILAATPSPTGGLAGEHLVEALIGGGLALVMTQLLFPLDPIKHVNQAAEPVFNRLADALELAAAGLAAGDHDRARQALEQARAIDPLVRNFQQALTVGYQVARLAPFRRRALGELDPYASAARQVDYAVRNTRVLARSAMVLLAAERPAPQGLVAGVRVLAETVRTLGGEVVAREPRRAAQRLALQAAVHAMTALEEDADLAVAMVVGQVRSTVLDLLRCSGMELADAQQALDEAAGPAIEGV